MNEDNTKKLFLINIPFLLKKNEQHVTLTFPSLENLLLEDVEDDDMDKVGAVYAVVDDFLASQGYRLLEAIPHDEEDEDDSSGVDFRSEFTWEVDYRHGVEN